MKKNSYVLLFTLFIFFPAHSQALSDKKLSSTLDKLLGNEFKPNEPGIVVLIARNNQVVYEKAFGSANVELNVPLQPDMVFRIGSITKQFTAIAILQLLEQGKISLKDSIQQYIKDFPSKGYTITIENLLTHTSGIMDYTNADTSHNPYIEREDFTPERIIGYFKNTPLEFEPGTKYNYSNSGYLLLAYIVQKVTGEDYHKYLEENILKPAGLANTFYATENTIVPKRVKGYTRDRGFYENCEYQTISIGFGCGDLMSTADDLYKWNNALLANKLVKKETLDKAFTPYILKNEIPTSYGYGWFINSVNGNKCIHHEGQVSGFISVEQYFPEKNIYVAILTNIQSGEDKTDFSDKRFELFNKISLLALGNKLQKEITVNEAILDSYTGTYEAGNKLFTITKNNDLLAVEISLAGRFELIPLSTNKFRLRGISVECTFEFIKDSLGKISELICVQKGQFNWLKVDEPDSAFFAENTPYAAYTGKYQLPTMRDAVTEVSIENNQLMTSSNTGLAKAALIPLSENKFKYNGANYDDLTYEFVKDKTGKVNSIIITQGGSVHCKKVK